MFHGRRQSKRAQKIGIVGTYGWGNLGDELVVSLLIKRIKQYSPTAEISGFSCVPEDSRQRHGIVVYPIQRIYETEPGSNSGVLSSQIFHSSAYVFFDHVRNAMRKWPTLYSVIRQVKDFGTFAIAELPFLFKCFNRLKGFDLLIVPGSGPLTDYWGGARGHPYMLFSWSLLARLRGIHVIALSIGAERLTTTLGKWFCLGFLSLCSYCSFRDEGSRSVMRKLGWRGDNPVCPDQGFGLAEFANRSKISSESRRPIIGINPVSAMTYGREMKDSLCHELYLSNMAETALQLIAARFCVHFCPTSKRQDSTPIESILKKMETIAASSSPSPDWRNYVTNRLISTVDEFIEAASEVDVMVASRFHGALIPFVLHKPVVSLSYERKLDTLMETMGQRQYALSFQNFLVPELIAKIHEAYAHRHEISSSLEVLVRVQQAQVTAQYNFVFTSVHAVA